MNLRTFTLVSAPATEPVALSDVKAFCRVDGDADNALLISLITTARRACEEYTKRAFITQTWKLVMDCFEEREEDTMPWLCREQAFKLSREPIQSVTSIKTTDSANTQTTVAPATYTLDQSSGQIFLNQGYAWPTELRDHAAVEAIYVCGYGDDGGDVPEPIKQAILQYTQDMYVSKRCSDLPEGCKTLLAPFLAVEAFGA